MVVVVGVAGCKRRVELYCETHADCAEWNLDFCDLEGEFPASEGVGNTCIKNPLDAGVADAGADAADTDGGVPTCTATTATCEGNALVLSDDSGTVCEVRECSLGCQPQEGRCVQVAPSNGLGEYLEQAAEAPDLDLTSGAAINTDDGTILDGDGTLVEVPTALLPAPTEGVAVRVFWASSVTLRDVSVSGEPALAIVSAGDVNIQGGLSLLPQEGDVPGEMPSCQPSAIVIDSEATESPGNAGGAYGATSGAGGDGAGDSGGSSSAPNGSIALVPLRGGCRGGSAVRDTPLPSGSVGGDGGGAVQITSSKSITVGGAASGTIFAGGGGGEARALTAMNLAGGGGGGSGGGILLEAPAVSVASNGRLLANGGGGSCHSVNGIDADPAGAPASGGPCTGQSGRGGAGGTRNSAAEAGLAGSSYGGGGGGSVGRIRINTASGNFTASGPISPNPSIGTLATE